MEDEGEEESDEKEGRLDLAGNILYEDKAHLQEKLHYRHAHERPLPSPIQTTHPPYLLLSSSLLSIFSPIFHGFTFDRDGRECSVEDRRVVAL